MVVVAVAAGVGFGGCCGGGGGVTESFTTPVEATCAGAAEALVLPCSSLASLNHTVELCSERASSAEVGVRWGARVREQRG